MSAKLVKELRDRTGAGFLDCKKALVASDNDIDKAIEWLQERGVAKAAKKAGAIAADGIVRASVSEDGKSAVLFELNSQTDFVARNDQFQSYVSKFETALHANDFASVEEANAIVFEGKTLADLCVEATSTIGEKIELRRAVKVNGDVIGAYTHVNQRVAAIVVTEGGDSETARNVAMHVASMNPRFLDENSVPADQVEAMKAEIAESPALQGKPEKIQASIAAGMLRKKLSETTLVDQEFVMEKGSVKSYLANHNAVATGMFRFEVAEGIEVEESDFAAEVAAQMGK